MVAIHPAAQNEIAARESQPVRACVKLGVNSKRLGWTLFTDRELKGFLYHTPERIDSLPCHRARARTVTNNARVTRG
jgi:hypothetical protein